MSYSEYCKKWWSSCGDGGPSMTPPSLGTASSLERCEECKNVRNWTGYPYAITILSQCSCMLFICVLALIICTKISSKSSNGFSRKPVLKISHFLRILKKFILPILQTFLEKLFSTSKIFEGRLVEITFFVFEVKCSVLLVKKILEPARFFWDTSYLGWSNS